mmetsp:Transcript_24170/g.47523  ORF Transcript_24170/g.47523 Transcript_24170/m.47523 type:complete len:119 (-) Transcript_24170:269-625(-)
MRHATTESTEVTANMSSTAGSPSGVAAMEEPEGSTDSSGTSAETHTEPLSLRILSISTRLPELCFPHLLKYSTGLRAITFCKREEHKGDIEKKAEGRREGAQPDRGNATRLLFFRAEE